MMSRAAPSGLPTCVAFSSSVVPEVLEPRAPPSPPSASALLESPSSGNAFFLKSRGCACTARSRAPPWRTPRSTPASRTSREASRPGRRPGAKRTSRRFLFHIPLSSASIAATSSRYACAAARLVQDELLHVQHGGPLEVALPIIRVRHVRGGQHLERVPRMV